MRWKINHVFRNRRVAVTRVPVQSEGKRQRHVLHFQIADENVFHKSTTRLRRLEANALIGADAAIVVSDDLANAAGSLTAKRDDATAATSDVAADKHVFSRTVHTQTVIVAAGLE